MRKKSLEKVRFLFAYSNRVKWSQKRREMHLKVENDFSFLMFSDSECPGWDCLATAMNSVQKIVSGLVAFIEHHHARRTGTMSAASVPSGAVHPSMDQRQQQHQARYKTSLCRDLTIRGSCPRGGNCTFAHSQAEIEQ